MAKLIAVSTSDNYGRKVERVDSEQTLKNVINFFKANGLKAIKDSYTDDKGRRAKSWPIKVRGIDQYYRPSKQFRIYFKIGYTRKNFIQSDKEGVIDEARLLSKAAEMFEEAQACEDAQVAKEAKNVEEARYCERMSTKLEKTGFKVDNIYHGFVLKFEAYNKKDIDAMVKKLFNI